MIYFRIGHEDRLFVGRRRLAQKFLNVLANEFDELLFSVVAMIRKRDYEESQNVRISRG